MANYDGEVIINTKIDEADYQSTLNGYKMGAQDLSNHIQQMTDKVKNLTASQRAQLQSMVSKFNEQNSAYANQEAKIESLKQKWYSLFNIEKQIASTENQIKSARDKLSQGGLGVGEYMALQDKLKQLESEYNRLIEKKKQAFGSQNTEGLGATIDKEQTKLDTMGNRLTDTFNRINAKVTDYQSKTMGASGSTGRFGNTMKSLGSGLQTVGSKVGQLANKGLTAIKNKFTSAKDSAQGFASKLAGNFKTILKYAVGLGTLRRIAGYLRNALKDGITAMANADAQTKASIDSIKNSVNGLKASLGSALAPLINAVAPAVNYVIGMITKAIHYVGMFISALTGKKMYTMATPINNTAKAINNNTKATNKNTKATKKNTKEKKKQNKELQRYLSGLDEMAIWEDKNDKDKGADKTPSTKTPSTNTPSTKTPSTATSGLQVKTSEVEIPKKIRDLANTIKGYIKKGDWKGLGTFIGKKIEEGLNAIPWATIQKKVRSGVSAITEFLNGIFGNMGLAKAFGKTIAEGINTISYAIDEFLTKFNFKDFGKWLGTGFQSLVTGINWEQIGTNLANGLNGLKAIIDGFWDGYKVGSLATGLSTAINNFFTKTDWKGLAQTLSTSIKNMLEEAFQLVMKIDWGKIGESIADFLMNIDWLGIIQKVFKLIGSLQGASIKLVSTLLMKLWNAVVSAVQDLWKKSGGNIFVFLWNIIKGIFSKLWGLLTSFLDGILAGLFGENAKQKVASAFQGIWEKVKSVFAPVVNFFKNIFSNAWKGIKNAWRSVVNFFKTIWNGIKTAFSAVVNFFKTAFTNAWTAIKTVWNAVIGFFRGIWNGIKRVFNVVVGWFKNIFTRAWNGIKAVFNGVKNFFKGVWGKITSVFSGAGNWFKNIFGKVWTAISSPFSKLIDTVKGIWGKIKGFFDGKNSIPQKIKNAFGAIGNVLKAPVNLMIDAINWVAPKLLSFIKKIKPILKAGVDLGGGNAIAKKAIDNMGTKWKPLPHLAPHLATGGVIPPNKEFLAVLGDQKTGNNIEAPEGLIRKIVREETGSNGQNMYEFVAQLNRKTLFDEVISEAKLRKSATGKNAFLGV